MAVIIGEEFRGVESRVRIATAFPLANTIVALPDLPMHALQREVFADLTNRDRIANDQSPLSEDEFCAAMEDGVDLLVDESGVLIRPDPDRMDLALAADEMLQEQLPKRSIKYLLLSDSRVRDALRQRGECWRTFRAPTAPREIRRLLAESRTAIENRAIYFYSPVSGTRFLTYQNFKRLGELDDVQLRLHLLEIATYISRRNYHGCREIEFFMATPPVATPDLEAAVECPAYELRQRFGAMCEQLRLATPAAYQRDELDDAEWRGHMFNCLMSRRGDSFADGQSTGLDSDFSMRVEWLPGGRIAEGELIMDPAIEEAFTGGRASSVVPGLILNLVQEYGDLEYINFASVLPSANRNEQRGGRREVYVAQIKQRAAARERLLIIRMQKWGVRERLDSGVSLETAMLDAEEYTEYVLDRRLACRQLGMNLSNRQTSRKVSETYHGNQQRYAGQRIWTPYFQREYIPGIATDQVPARNLASPEYVTRFARLLGKAAASNLLLGRAELTGQAIFDVGDEIVMEDECGMPTQIAVSDHVGTFVDWTGSLESRMKEYAQPAVRRKDAVPDARLFAEAYVGGFVELLTRVRDEYRKHARAFDTLFKYRPWDADGSLACRWSSVLKRLREADPKALGQLLGSHLEKHF